jgi:hypothetical protein
MLTTAGWWGEFWANFLSDVVVGAGIVVCLNYLVGRKLSAFELSQERKAEKRSDINKAIRYLDLLRAEIQGLVTELPRLLKIFTETGWGREIRIETPFWDVVERSGELPRLLSPSLLWSLTRFYSNLAYARRARDLLIQSWLVPQPDKVPCMEKKQAAFIDMTVSGLDPAMENGQELVGQVDSEIEDLKKQLERTK